MGQSCTAEPFPIAKMDARQASSSSSAALAAAEALLTENTD